MKTKPQKPTFEFKITNSSTKTKEFELFNYQLNLKGILSQKQEGLEIACDNEKYYWELFSKKWDEYTEIYLIELISTNEKQISEKNVYEIYDDSMSIGVARLNKIPINFDDSRNKINITEITPFSNTHSIKTEILPHTHLIINFYLREVTNTKTYKNI